MFAIARKPRTSTAPSHMPQTPFRRSVQKPEINPLWQRLVLSPPRTTGTRSIAGDRDDLLEREADDAADQVMRMAAPTPISLARGGTIQRKCAQCEDEEKVVARERAPGGGSQAALDTETAIRVADRGGKPLPKAERDFFEPRFGHDFSRVRVHADGEATRGADAVQARAYTVGHNIVFGRGQFSASAEGRRLIAHELAHVVQQGRAPVSGAAYVQRASAGSTCPADWDTTVNDDHTRGLDMIDVATTKLGTYNGTAPIEVHDALAAHFHGTSTALASWVRFNLRILRQLARLASYKCVDPGGMCIGSRSAWTVWCVPFTDIRICSPAHFGKPANVRSRELIHEWVHRYGCNFDLGYHGSEDYGSSGTTRALFNADPWAWLVFDVQ